MFISNIINNGNILSTNLYELIPNKKEQNNFIKYFNKTFFNSTNISDYKGRILSSNSIAETIVSTETPVSNSISSRIIGFKENGSYEDNFEQVHILIINPEYQEYGNSEYIKLENTVFEFVINNV